MNGDTVAVARTDGRPGVQTGAGPGTSLPDWNCSPCHNTVTGRGRACATACASPTRGPYLPVSFQRRRAVERYLGLAPFRRAGSAGVRHPRAPLGHPEGTRRRRTGEVLRACADEAVRQHQGPARVTQPQNPAVEGPQGTPNPSGDLRLTQSPSDAGLAPLAALFAGMAVEGLAVIALGLARLATPS